MEIEGRGEQITEYRIAVEALGRLKINTTTEDSAVRNGPTPCEQNWKSVAKRVAGRADPVSIFSRVATGRILSYQKSPDENGSVAPVIPSAEMAEATNCGAEVARTLVWSSPPGVGIFGGRLVTRVPKTHARQLIAEGMGSPFHKDGDSSCLLPATATAGRARYTSLQSLRVPWMLRRVYEWYRKYHPLLRENLYLEFVILPPGSETRLER